MPSTKYFLNCLLAIMFAVTAQVSADCNKYGLHDWEELPSNIQRPAMRLGFWKKRWNHIDEKVNPMEAMKWDDLTNKWGKKTKYGWFPRITPWRRDNTLKKIGFPGRECYDMFVNHYAGYVR